MAEALCTAIDTKGNYRVYSVDHIPFVPSGARHKAVVARLRPLFFPYAHLHLH